MAAAQGASGLRGRIERFWALDRARRWAGLASVIWIVLVLAYAVGFLGVSRERGTVFLDLMFFLAALVLPLILIWLVAQLALEMQRQRALIAALAEVALPLTEALGATRDSLERHAPASPDALASAVRTALAETRLAEGQAALQATLRTIDARIASVPAAASAAGSVAGASAPVAAPRARSVEPADDGAGPTRAEAVPERRGDRRAASRAKAAAAAGAAEPALPLAEPEAPPRPDWPDLIRALDFPRDAEDREGFRALKAALRNPTLAQMLQAAEDVLTLLSQEGVYMDDLAVEPGDPAQWRRFMAGARGADVSGVGGVQDPQALETARRLVRSDPIFRDTALFFQRRFDAVLAEFARDASDDELLALADTRSGRAFQLMARQSGSFG